MVLKEGTKMKAKIEHQEVFCEESSIFREQ